jgi:hypothetical protein
MDVMETATELPQIAIGAAQMETLYGSIAGIVVGASLGGFVASRISFGGRIGNIAASSIQFLIGAGLYGFGLMGRVERPALRSATQISGVVIAGMGLGRLLAEFGMPTFGLGSEGTDGRVLGQSDDGYVVGHAAEQDYMEEWNADDSPDYAPANSASGEDPTVSQDSPNWTNTSLSGVEDPWQSHVDVGMVIPGSVDQWFGSAEDFNPIPMATLGNHIQGSIGNGSVIGQ